MELIHIDLKRYQMRPTSDNQNETIIELLAKIDLAEVEMWLLFGAIILDGFVC